MKKFLALTCILGMIVFMGCGTKSTNVTSKAEDLITHTDKIYIAIKTIVTDESVRILLTEDDIKKLKQAEALYLSAKEVLVEASLDQDTILDLIDCADVVLTILGKETLQEKYNTEITAIRVGANVLIALYKE